jgi:hypothetical protein
MKKTIGILLLFSVFATTSYAQKAVKKLAITVQNGKLNVNNINLAAKWEIAPMVKMLGIGARIRDGFNKTHTYDNYGIVLFESKIESTPSGKLSEFQVYFSPLDEESAVSAKGYFGGTFTMGSLKLKKDITADEVREKLLAVGYTESESYSSHNFRFAKDGLYIYFLFDEIEQRLIKISIGKDVHKDE